MVSALLMAVFSLADTVPLVDQTAVAALSLAVLGVGASPWATRLAASRTAAQPLPCDIDAENEILDAAASDPVWAASTQARLIAEQAELDVKDAELFVTDGHAARWLEIIATAQSAENEEDAVPAAQGKKRAARDKAADKVIGLAFDRALYEGAVAIERCGDPAVALQRQQVRATPGRIAVAALMLGAGGALAGWVAPSAAAAISLLALVVGGYLVAMVDHDTLYLDVPGWLGCSAVAWVAMATWCVSQGRWSSILWGVAAGAMWWIVFESMNLMWKILRGVDGMGGGDGVIVMSTAGLPVAMTGSAQIALWSVLAGLVAVLAVRLPMMLFAKRGTMREAFALGPYLAVGWQLALVAWQLGWLAS